VISTDGSPVTGETVTVSTGTWTGSPTPTYTYQWKRAGTNISGATASSYVLQVADEGTNVTCTVTGTNASGSAGATSTAIVPAAAGGGTKTVRAFDGTDDCIILPKPVPYFPFYPFTYLAVVKRTVATDYDGIFSIGPPSGGGPIVVYEFTNSGAIELVIDSGHAARTIGWDVTTWLLVGVTRSVTGGNCRHHRWNGTTWLHSDADALSGGGTASDPTDWGPGSNEFRIGNWNSSFNFFEGHMAVHAMWTGTALADAAIEALAGGTKAAWLAASPDHLWEFSQASAATPVQDEVGIMDEISHVGTSVVVGGDLPSSIYIPSA